MKISVHARTHGQALHMLCCALVLLTLSACSVVGRSPETHYYVMSLPGEATARSVQTVVTGPRIGIGPVTLPGYLDRQQIFIRQEQTAGVRLEEYNRWGEPFANGITRLLVEDMTVRLESLNGIVLPLHAGMPFDWRISLDIIRFDGAPGQDVVLDAGWCLSTGEGEAVREGHFLARTTAADGIEGLIAAHGTLLSQLGEVLTAAMRTARTATSR